ncbi:hypothetical protein, partial [Campylobacter geochelonis]
RLKSIKGSATETIDYEAVDKLITIKAGDKEYKLAVKIAKDGKSVLINSFNDINFSKYFNNILKTAWVKL